MGRGPTWREKEETSHYGRKSHLTSGDMMDIDRKYNKFLSIVEKKHKEKKVKKNLTQNK